MMNFYSKNEKLKKEVTELFGEKISSDGKLSLSANYSQNRRLSTVTIEFSGASVIHQLIFIYTRSLMLYDIQSYKNKTFHRIQMNGSDMKRIDFINKFILRNIARSSTIGITNLKESVIENMKDDAKDYQIEKLKDQLRIARDQIQSLRNQIKFVKNSEKAS